MLLNAATRTKLRGYLPTWAAKNLRPGETKDGKSYECPICGSKRGGKLLNGELLKCFSCGFSGDIIELYKRVNGCSFGEARAQIEQELAQERVQERPSERTAAPKETKKAVNLPTLIPLERFEAAQRYLDSRGIDWHKVADLGTVGGAVISGKPALAFALNGEGVQCRLLGDSVPHNQRYRRYGKLEPYLALQPPGVTASRTIWLVEGEIDALSIYSLGRHAIALSSTVGTKAFLSQLAQQPLAQDNHYLLLLDNDAAGQEAAAKLAQGLVQLQVTFGYVRRRDGAKDANELLQAGELDGLLSCYE